MKFVKFFRRHEKNGGLVLQDQECVIAAGSYILFFYPKTGEILQIDEKVDSYPGAVSIPVNEYVACLGFFRGCGIILRNFLGIGMCKDASIEEEEAPETFEAFFNGANTIDEDLRPPIVIGSKHNEEI